MKRVSAQPQSCKTYWNEEFDRIPYIPGPCPLMNRNKMPNLVLLFLQFGVLLFLALHLMNRQMAFCTTRHVMRAMSRYELLELKNYEIFAE
jgi:hypothetical protein